MPKKNKSHWPAIIKIGTGLFGAGFIGLAVTVGVYKQKVDRLTDDIATFKIIHDFDKRIAILEERTRGNNAPVPAVATQRPAAGGQR